MAAQRVALTDAAGKVIAELLLTHEEDGWLTGIVLAQHLSPKLKSALDWYAEVLENQMLSYLDEATAGVERFGLRLRDASDALRKVYSLHIGPLDQLHPEPRPCHRRLACRRAKALE